MRSKGWIALAVCLVLWTISAVTLAESTYQELCRQNGYKNPDIIAWLEVPGAAICEPVMRHPTDDSYYSAKAPDGKENRNGALYVQAKYNAGDFSDPVTMIYGNSTSETAPFYELQELYSGSFDACRTVYLHTPEATQEYEVFASVPHSSIHILHYYDFHSARRYKSFFDSIFSTRALGMHLMEEDRPQGGKDRVIILSTGLRGDPLQRYLVMAKTVKKMETPEPNEQ